MPLKYNGNVNYVLDKIKELSKAYPYYNNFLNEYFVKNKIKYFIDDSLNYSKYPKNVRSNSILERYNRHVKEQINKKRYCNWIIFLKFINTEISRVDNILSKNENINIAFSKKKLNLVQRNFQIIIRKYQKMMLLLKNTKLMKNG